MDKSKNESFVLEKQITKRIHEDDALEMKGNKLITLDGEFYIHRFDLVTNEFIILIGIDEEQNLIKK